MELSAQQTGETKIVRVHGPRIDAANAFLFKEQFRGVLDDCDSRILLDLSEVTFIDSSGLGAVVAMFKLIGQSGRLELAGLQPAVQKLFALTRMDTIFTIHESPASAPDIAAGAG